MMRDLAGDVATASPAIESALRDHAAPYFDDDTAALERALAPVLAGAVPTSVAVVSVDRTATIELALRVPWDEEHTLGARIVGGSLTELNGSILEP